MNVKNILFILLAFGMTPGVWGMGQELLYEKESEAAKTDFEVWKLTDSKEEGLHHIFGFPKNAFPSYNYKRWWQGDNDNFNYSIHHKLKIPIRCRSKGGWENQEMKMQFWEQQIPLTKVEQPAPEESKHAQADHFFNDSLVQNTYDDDYLGKLATAQKSAHLLKPWIPYFNTGIWAGLACTGAGLLGLFSKIVSGSKSTLTVFTGIGITVTALSLIAKKMHQTKKQAFDSELKNTLFKTEKSLKHFATDFVQHFEVLRSKPDIINFNLRDKYSSRFHICKEILDNK